jgi:hypothetical protein
MKTPGFMSGSKVLVFMLPEEGGEGGGLMFVSSSLCNSSCQINVNNNFDNFRLVKNNQIVNKMPTTNSGKIPRPPEHMMRYMLHSRAVPYVYYSLGASLFCGMSYAYFYMLPMRNAYREYAK